MNIIIEIEHHLTNDILSSIEELNQHSKTPNVHTNAFFIKCFNKFLLNEWKPLFIKIIKKKKPSHRYSSSNVPRHQKKRDFTL